MPGLTLQQATDRATYAPGDTITYTLTYASVQAQAANLTLSDTLPANVSLVAGSAGSAVLNAGTLTWSLGALAAGASGSLSFQVTVDAGVATGTVIVNSASLTFVDAPAPLTSTVAVVITPPCSPSPVPSIRSITTTMT